MSRQAAAARDEGRSLAVVGVLFAEGAANDVLVPVWRHLPPETRGAACWSRTNRRKRKQHR